MPACAPGVDGLFLSLGSLEAGPVQAREVRLKVEWGTGESAALLLEAPRISFGPGGPILTDVRLRCARGRILGDRLSCEQGLVDYVLGEQRTSAASVSFSWIHGAEPRGELVAGGLGIAGGTASLDARVEGPRWRARLRASGVDGSRLGDLLAGPAAVPAGVSLSGQASLDLEARGEGALVQASRWTLEHRGLGFADADQAWLGDRLSGSFSGEMTGDAAGLRGHWNYRLTSGEILTPALYLDATGAAVEARADFTLDPDLRALVLSGGRLTRGDLVRAQYNLDAELVPEPAVTHLSVRLAPTAAGPLYRDFVQPALGAAWAADLTLGGQVSLDLVYGREGHQSVRAGMDALSLTLASDSAPERSAFGIEGIRGELLWSDGEAAEISRLGWRRGYLFGTLELGASTLALKALGPRVELAQPASLPVLDGELKIDRLAYGVRPAGDPRLDFDGLLTPVSLGRFSQAVGWPELSGKISGMIPGLRLEGDTLSVEGVLLVRAFDGRLLIEDLQLTDPFGAWPVLTADLSLHDLDLEQLTGTFAFGKITGRLEGRVRDLRLENWRPVAFDARLQTPPDDESRHRISQRAIENISKLGGSGAAGAVSRGLLGVFEDFGYERLGIGCRLSRGVCEMGGVAPADNGYYLVQGAGVPRVDVKGFNRRIDWDRLVKELASIQERGAPTIE